MSNTLIDKHYSGKNVKEYDAKRQSSKWKAETNFVKEHLEFHCESKTVIDAPLGTNRFARMIAECEHIEKAFGLELSEDMLAEAKRDDADGKMEFIQHDLCEPFPKKADTVLMMRMLNLIKEETALLMFENALNAANEYVVISLRIGDPKILENKIHVQQFSTFDDCAGKCGFEVYDWEDVPTDKYGDYCLITYARIPHGETHNGQTD